LVKKLAERLRQPLNRFPNVGWIKRRPDWIDLAALVGPHQAAVKVTQSTIVGMISPL
jgi:hypothetical protein